MALNRNTAVIGSAIAAPAANDGRALEELLYDLVQDALKDADLKIEDIDGIVVGSNDQFDGRAISVMMASGSVGGVDRDILSTPSAGEHAMVMGVMRVATGLYRTQLIVSWSPTEADSLSEAQRLGADPYYHRKLPMDELNVFALQASALTARCADAQALSGKIAERSHAHAKAAYPDAPRENHEGQVPWPLKPGMVTRPVTGAVALIVASEEFVEERGAKAPAWIRGMGWATETGYLGDRDLSRAPALRAAADRAFADGFLSGPAEADLIELTGATPYQEMIVLEELGLCDADTWAEDIDSGRFGVSGALPLNPSGGPIPINPVFCTGLMRIAEAARQVRGQAGAHQLENVKTAVAHAASGFAMMYQTVFVLSTEKQGAAA